MILWQIIRKWWFNLLLYLMPSDLFCNVVIEWVKRPHVIKGVDYHLVLERADKLFPREEKP